MKRFNQTTIYMLGLALVAQPAFAKDVTAALSADELSKANLSVVFSGTQVQLNGSLPEECINRLTMDVVKHAPEDVDAEDGFANIADLDKQTSKVGYRLNFKSDEKVKSLADCRDINKDAEQKDVTGYGALNKQTLDGNEYARLGMMNEKGDISLDDKSLESDSYKKVSKVITYKDCADCKISISKIQKAMGELDGQPAIASPLRIALIDKGLSDTVAQLKEVDSVRKLGKINEDLFSYAKWIAALKVDSDDRDALLDRVKSALRDLQLKTGEISYKDPSHAGKYADMISKNGCAISRLPGMDKDFREEQKNVCDAYAKNGSMRLEFVQSVDADNVEVRDYLTGGAAQLHALQKNANSKCRMIIQTAAKVNACNQAISDMKTAQAQLESVAKRYMTAQQLPAELQANSTNSFAANGTAPKGGYYPNLSSGNGTQTAAINSVFGLNPGVFQNSAQYAPATQSQFSVSAPNYQAPANSQFKNANPAVAIPLNESLLPTQQTNVSSAPQYMFSAS